MSKFEHPYRPDDELNTKVAIAAMIAVLIILFIGWYVTGINPFSA